MTHTDNIDANHAQKLVASLVSPEKQFFKLAIVYGLAISLLTLAIPIAVQTLINTVVNIASMRAVVTLSILLLVTLTISGLLSALRTYVMEKYERHIYARLTAEISVRTLMSDYSFFEGRRNVDVPNRYFDINTFQKNIPTLMIDGFALLLQLVVGFTLVSFYHPFFTAFCLILVLVLFLIWTVWARPAIRAAVKLSHAKYATAKWLSDMAAAHSFFRTGRHIEYAQTKTEDNTREYIHAHRNHFKYTFRQTVALLVFYALASSSLLGLGGYLVVIGELSIGQLVAAELILTAIFFGLSKARNYLKLYYELCGAADELSIIYNMPTQNSMQLSESKIPVNSELVFKNVELSNSNNNEKYALNFTLESGSKLYMFTSCAWLQRSFISMLKFYSSPPRGQIRLGQQDLSEYRTQQLNNPPIRVINKAPIIECSIKEFMVLNEPSTSVAQIQDAIERVGLHDVINQFPNGIDTLLSPLGAPFQPHEFLLLKLAAVLVCDPKVVILTQYFDNLPTLELKKLLGNLSEEPFTVLYFTNHPQIEAFDQCLCLDWLKEGN